MPGKTSGKCVCGSDVVQSRWGMGNRGVMLGDMHGRGEMVKQRYER